MSDHGTRLREALGLYTQEDIAAILQVEPRTVEKWRSERRGPPWVTVGRKALYRRAEF